MPASDRLHQLFEQVRNADGDKLMQLRSEIVATGKTLGTYKAFLPYLQDRFWKIRLYAAEALGNFEDPEVAQHLIDQFETETEEDDEEVQVAIVTSLRYQKT